MPIGHFADMVEDKEALDLALLIIDLHQRGAPMAEIVRVVALALARAKEEK